LEINGVRVIPLYGPSTDRPITGAPRWRSDGGWWSSTL